MARESRVKGTYVPSNEYISTYSFIHTRIHSKLHKIIIINSKSGQISKGIISGGDNDDDDDDYYNIIA